MDIYTRIVDEFSRIPHVKEWEEVQALFRRVAAGKPRHWLLPLRACEAAGGDQERAVPAVLSVACCHIGIVLVDDMLDADPRGEHLKVGEGAAANMASALQSAAVEAVARSSLEPAAKLAAMESVNRMFLATTIGQHWDVNSIVQDEDSYWKIARAKSSPFFGAAFQIGAWMGGASAETADRVAELGKLYGEMVQIHDDVNDTLAVPAQPDWDKGRAPLTILFAGKVDHPLRRRFEELRPHVRDSPQVLEEAQEILIHCGAVSYCIHQLLQRHEIVKGILGGLMLARGGILEEVFDDLIQPVFRLFREVDASFIDGAHPADRA